MATVSGKEKEEEWFDANESDGTPRRLKVTPVEGKLHSFFVELCDRDENPLRPEPDTIDNAQNAREAASIFSRKKENNLLFRGS